MLALPLLLAAAAPDPAFDADLRCLAVLSFAVSKAEEKERSGLIMGAMYYVGRIDAARPGYDYAAGLKALLLDPASRATIPTEAPRCLETIRARGRALGDAGRTLQSLDPRGGAAK